MPILIKIKTKPMSINMTNKSYQSRHIRLNAIHVVDVCHLCEFVKLD